MKRRDVKSCLIVCNGELQKRIATKFFNKEVKLHYYIIATDGAANTLIKYGYSPDLIIGDLDSISPAVLKKYLAKKVTVRKHFDQDLNDFEKALKFAFLKGYQSIKVIGATGKRLDHTLTNLSVLKKYYKKADIRLIDSDFEMYFTTGKSEFDYKKNEVVSLLAIPKAKNITTCGVKYKLKNESLDFGKRQGGLNVSTSDKVEISVGSGELLVFKKHLGNIT